MRANPIWRWKFSSFSCAQLLIHGDGHQESMHTTYSRSQYSLHSTLFLCWQNFRSYASRSQMLSNILIQSLDLWFFCHAHAQPIRIIINLSFMSAALKNFHSLRAYPFRCFACACVLARRKSLPSWENASKDFFERNRWTPANIENFIWFRKDGIRFRWNGVFTELSKSIQPVRISSNYDRMNESLVTHRKSAHWSINI